MRIGVVCLVLLGLSSGFAVAGQNSSFGIKGGVSWASMSIEPDVTGNFEYWMRHGGGVCLSLALSPTVWLDLDVLYLQKGAIELTDDPETQDTEWRFNYAVVSPMLRVAPSRAGSGPYLLGGVEISYLLNWRIDFTDILGGTGSYSHGSAIKDLDYGVTVGGGFQMSGSGHTAFFLEGRYAMGLRDINNQVADYVPAESGRNFEIKTRGIYVFAGVRF